VASERSPLMSTFPALGVCAGALVTGASGWTELTPPSTGTSVTVERGVESAGVDAVCSVAGDDLGPC